MATSRPRERRAQILSAASELFRRSGYHRVGIVEIAASEDMTSAALYRHFPNKQALLTATISDAVTQFEALAAPEASSSLPDVLDRLVTLSLHHPGSALLWTRELRHLDTDDQSRLRARLGSLVRSTLGVALAQARPDLPADQGELLMWAIMGAAIAPTNRLVSWTGPRPEQALRQVLADCSTSRLPTDVATDFPGPRQVSGIVPLSRPEAVLMIATELFTEHGFHGVGVEDVARRLGISGAALYNHYPSKQAILEAALVRALDVLFFDLTSVLRTHEDAIPALREVVRRYIRLSLENGPALGAIFSEIRELPDDTRAEMRRRLREYSKEWEALLSTRGDAPVDATVRVVCAISAINHLVLIPRVRTRAAAGEELLAIALTILNIDTGGR